MSQFILIINGPICSGKTSIVDLIMDSQKKVFRLSTNKIKFLISDYDPSRDRNLVHDCLVLIAEKMLQNGMSLILEGGSVAQGELNEKLAELSNKYDVKLVTVNIEAPLEVLKQRFKERVKASESRGTKISVKTDAEFMKRHAAYTELKSPHDQSFDSSTLTSDEIAKKVMALV